MGTEPTGEYDAELIRKQAQLLDAEADRAAIVTMVLAGVLGVVVGAASFFFLSDRHEVLSIVLVLGLPLASAVLGGMHGESRALKLRSHSQQLLILLAIERDLRQRTSHPQTVA
jgi:VIT1/CCC1 family predicted Fe2+/Mn2+ transporter